MAKARRLSWECCKCGEPIEDGDGYLELPSGALRTYRQRVAAWEEAHPREPGGWNAVSLAEYDTYPERVQWLPWHRGCDPEADGYSHYWIAVERIRDVEQLLEWTAHLFAKKWLPETNWYSVLRRHTERRKGRAS